MYKGTYHTLHCASLKPPHQTEVHHSIGHALGGSE